MSESSFPLMGTQVDDAPAAELDETRGTRRVVLILVVVGVLVLGALAYFFAFSGDDSPESASALPKSGTVQTTPTPAVTPKLAKAPKLSKKAIGKDPFKALVAPAAAAAPAVVPGVQTAVAGSSTSGGTVVTSGGTTTTAGGTTTTAGGTTTTTSVTPLTVKVISVTADNMSSRVTVGGKSYSVAPGDVFGTYFKVLRLKNGNCGSFSYGDERFDLCEGDSARMK